MDKIKWCFKQKKGIRIVDPSERISEAYLKESSEDFDMVSISNKKWKVISSYYACYNALYSILMKCGIKCEIHDCSLELMKLFGFSKKERKFLEDLKNDRINVQYYLKDPSLRIDESELIGFIKRCKEILLILNDNKINGIRKELISDLENIK